MTELLFREEAYLQSTTAKVSEITDQGGLVFDKTIFYAAAGGQPGDRGTLQFGSRHSAIIDTIYDARKTPLHIPQPHTTLPAVGDEVLLQLDWANRFRNMRAHSMLHLLCACVPFAVTGGAISEEGGRIDFDIPEGQIPDKDELTAKLNQLITANHAITSRWISDEEMQDNMHLVRTMSVKPPMGTGRVRLVMIGPQGSIDLQPCGGTHVRSTAEIGPVRVEKIQNKGKINRRIRVVFA